MDSTDLFQTICELPPLEQLKLLRALHREICDSIPDTDILLDVPVDSLKPSPENDAIYGAVGAADEAMEALIESIAHRGLAEAIIVSSDGYIVSGHRRYYAVQQLGWDTVTVRLSDLRRSECLDQWPAILAEYNPQRIKKPATLLREALLRGADNPASLLKEHTAASMSAASNGDYRSVLGHKHLTPISKKKQEFLRAAQQVVFDLKVYWPITVRAVHYRLLNAPPQISTPKKPTKPASHYTYRNDLRSYQALTALLRDARYMPATAVTSDRYPDWQTEIPVESIDDPTRPQWTHEGWFSVSEFVTQAFDGFLRGYHRHLQESQPRHIELLGEKNTLAPMLRPLAQEYCVPLTLGRGYGTTPMWRDMAARFERSGASKMTLIVASDFDPEGLDLADDAIRSLRDLWGLDVEYQRVGVTLKQIEELGLKANCNPAKVTSSRFKTFVSSTGGADTWELEALPPEYLVSATESAIRANLDLSIFAASKRQQNADVEVLAETRRQLISALDL